MPYCAGKCKSEIVDGWSLTNGEILCRECFNFFKTYEQRPQSSRPFRPSVPAYPCSKTLERSRRHEWTTPLSLSFVALALGFALRLGITLTAGLFVIVVTITGLVSQLLYKRRINELDPSSANSTTDSVCQRNEEESNNEMRAYELKLAEWRKMQEIYEHCCNYWPERPPDWNKRIEKVLSRDRRRCTECYANSGLFPLQIHHIQMIKNGGNHLEENLVTLCERCHAYKPGHEHMIPAVRGRENKHRGLMQQLDERKAQIRNRRTEQQGS